MYKLLVCASTIALFLVIGFGSQYILGPDNKIEEAIEDHIEEELGIEIDFSDY